ncbi:zinc finger protein 250-like [Nothobranchius furzeri]|uniref:Zinc finger protein 250-like n=1 Tax=Nothobranchius furzeri TaxID=105023 RepID=A0A9D3C261_NOTFU|nr:zinc finger protein 250-like [Nothobranchius furzeri]
MDTDFHQLVLVKEEATEGQNAGVDQQDPETLQLKEEQEELWTSLEGAQLHLKEETDGARFPITAVSIKSEDDEEKPLFSQLHQQQIENRDVPTSSSADQMTAETSSNSDLNPCEQTATSETEVSGDYEKKESEISDSGSETGDEDDDWNESGVNKSFSCPDCGKHFLHKWSLQKHMRVKNHSAIRSSGCLVNKKCVRVKKHVDSYRKVQKEQTAFSCDNCGKRFSYKTNLNRHMGVHTGEKHFTCELCGQRFSQKAHLNRHDKLHTGQKTFTCELCGQRFSQKAHLNRHIKLHTGQKPFVCELCGQRFTQKTSLNRHMSIHTGQKHFLCELCGQRFTHEKILNKHMSIHTGQKPFTCELCGQGFIHKTSLNRHMSIHTGQKPFACELCGQRFNLKTSLNRHVRVHTGQKPFACELCGQRFTEKTSLNRHVSVHTGQKPFAYLVLLNMPGCSCDWLFLKQEAEDKQRDREYEFRKLELEAETSIKLKRLELEMQAQAPRRSWSPSAGLTGETEKLDVGKCMMLMPQFREAEVDSYFAAFERIAAALSWPREVWPLLLQCKRPPMVPPAPCLADGGPVYSVKKHLASRRVGRGIQYLVDWVVYGPADRQWVLERHILSRELINRFYGDNPTEPRCPSKSRTLSALAPLRSPPLPCETPGVLQLNQITKIVLTLSESFRWASWLVRVVKCPS